MPRSYSMAKRSEATDRTRQQIEEALIRLLGSRPYQSITMADVAAEADVAVRTVQRHYRTKDNLLASCAAYPGRVIAQQSKTRPPPKSAEVDIRRLVEDTFALFEDHRAAIWAAYCRATEVPQIQEALRESIADHAERIGRLIARWPDAWTTSAGDAKKIIASLTSFPAWRSFTEPGRFTPAQAASEVAEILCRRLLRRSPR